MAAKDHLVPVRTKQEARERGRNGGIASGKARRAAKVYSDAARALMASHFKTKHAGEELDEFCKGFGFKETETGAIMLALSDFFRGLREGDKDSIERLLSAAGINQSADAQSESAFEPTQIYVLPAAKPGEDIVIEEEDGEDP